MHAPPPPPLLAHPAPRLGDRSMFPQLTARAYLNHAAVSPPSLPVVEAARDSLERYAQAGMGAIMSHVAQRERLRGTLAGLVGARPEDIGMVANTTTGLIDLALSLPWTPGARVLCFDGEFPTNVTPWQQAAAAFGGRVELLSLAGFGDGSGEGLARVEAALRGGGVAVVAVSAVQFQTGLAMPLGPLAQLCHAHGAQLCVDAIQAVGAVPLDVGELDVDYLVAGSHKWLMGLEGSAMVYVKPALQAALVPRVAGWLSHQDALGFLFEGAGHLRYDRPIQVGPARFEVGAPNAVGLRALEVSAGLVATLGVPAIFAHVQHYLDALESGLLARGFQSKRAVEPAARSCILSVLAPDDIETVDLVAPLGARGIAVTGPDGHLRFAPHWPNAHDEVPAVLDAVDAALAELRR